MPFFRVVSISCYALVASTCQCTFLDFSTVPVSHAGLRETRPFLTVTDRFRHRRPIRVAEKSAGVQEIAI